MRLFEFEISSDTVSRMKEVGYSQYEKKPNVFTLDKDPSEAVIITDKGKIIHGRWNDRLNDYGFVMSAGGQAIKSWFNHERKELGLSYDPPKPPKELLDWEIIDKLCVWTMDNNQIPINSMDNIVKQLPQEAKTTDSEYCYRVLSLDEESIKKLLSNQSLPCGKYESWTETLSGVKYIYDLIKTSTVDPGKITVLLKIKPSSVAVSFSKLVSTSVWKKSFNYYMSLGNEFSEELSGGSMEDFKDEIRLLHKVQEIILINKSFNLSNVVGVSVSGDKKELFNTKNVVHSLKQAIGE